MTNFSYQNSQNRSNGRYFESVIEESLDFYREKGFASIQKTPEPMRPVGKSKNGIFPACFSEKAQPDYKGVLSGGRAIIFEAKYTSGDKIYQSAVTEKQAQIFEQYEKMGARCFIMVCIQDVDFYRVPWNVWICMKKIFGHKYMNQKELESYKVPVRGLMPCILEGVEL